MNKIQNVKSVFCVACFVLVSAASVLWVNGALANGVADIEPSQSTLSVRGEAQILAEPDQVSFSLGVTTESAVAKKAIADNSKKMQSVIRALDLAGLSSYDYKTQNYRVQPVWSSRPNNAGKQWKAEIVAYRVSNNLQVTTQLIDRVGDIIAKATDAGANQVNAIHFSLSDPRQYRQQAITRAMTNAKDDAETLAAASGDVIVRTLTLQLDNAAASKVRVEMAKMSRSNLLMSDAVSSAAPPIESGDITVRASVSVTYEIAPNH